MAKTTVVSGEPYERDAGSNATCPGVLGDRLSHPRLSHSRLGLIEAKIKKCANSCEGENTCEVNIIEMIKHFG